jgi:hypothetical protein
MARETLTGTGMTGTAGVIMPERVGPIRCSGRTRG